MIMAAILLVVIGGVGLYSYNNWDKLFTNKVEVRYPDGCIEIYLNTVLTTPECTEGKLMIERNKQCGGVGIVQSKQCGGVGIVPWGGLNLTNLS